MKYNGQIKGDEMLNKIDVLRYSDNGDSTLGLFFLNGKWFCYSLEDEARDEKVSGETCIPPGLYQLGIRVEDTPLTKKYRERFDWFQYHIQVMDVPDFSYVYIHVGNDEDDTDACILVGDDANNNNIGRAFIRNSGRAYERFYKDIYPKIMNGETVLLEVRSINEYFHRGE